MRVIVAIALLSLVHQALAFESRTANDGNVLLEDVPEVPQSLVDLLNRYSNVRDASFLDFAANGESVFVRTRFGEVAQIHRVDMPGGARHQLTFFDEPIGEVTSHPKSEELIFAMDAGGSEFSQLFALDPADGSYRMLTDGESRNGAVIFDQSGKHIAYQSTRRNGAANDIWVMDPDSPEAARLVLPAPGGAWWGPTDFSPDGKSLLVIKYVSSTQSSIYLVDLESTESQLLVGDDKTQSRNFPLAFAPNGRGFYFLTDAGGEFTTLSYRGLDADAVTIEITSDLNWDVSGFALSEDGQRGAFTTNEDGMSQLYLFDPANRDYQKVSSIPVGIIGEFAFSPDADRLAMSLNTPQTPSDTFVLALGDAPLDSGELTRWTFSETGGLDSSKFAVPDLVHYPTFDQVDGAARKIPAFVYRPQGDGPHPVIIRIHGGPEGQARPSFSSTYQMWIDELGAAVVVPNVRGSAGYGKTYVALDNGYQREDSVKDIGALLDWIATQPDLDADRVAVYGGSYGGYMVLACAVHYSDRINAVVDIVGISNFVTFLENTQSYRQDLRRVEYGDERDPAMRKHLEAISPNNHVDKMNVPMFVAQGQNDPRVPVTESEQIVAALRDNGQSVWYMNALNEGHGFRKKENRDLYTQIVMMFFQKHLIGSN